MEQSEYRDGRVYRRALRPPVSSKEAFELNTREVSMLRQWARQRRADLLRKYLSQIHLRVWDEKVDVDAIERACRGLLRELDRVV